MPTIPPLSDAARIELALLKRGAKGATAHELGDELHMKDMVVLDILLAMLREGKVEQCFPSLISFRIIRS